MSDDLIDPNYYQRAVTTTAERFSRPVAAEKNDPVSPNHYQFPNGAEVIHISEWLTSNAGQAVQYIARSCRLDGRNKGNTIEDLRKSLVFVQREIERLGG
ncbi:hypothetical protein ACH47B_13135 [Rhodococcus sp. NPDC019627]|uniref:hypothetical protein n=1 Tax=unclassified Rhodococcus (in: high G+C Gram-positive bacteria) TaxID=192944 RepID=UPI0033D209E9